MSADTAKPATLSPTAPLKAAKASLIADLLALVSPHYPAFPCADDHQGVAAHIRDVANIFDRYLAAIGSDVRDNATTSIDASLFAGSFSAAVEGNETWAVEQQGEFLLEERRSMRRGS